MSKTKKTKAELEAEARALALRSFTVVPTKKRLANGATFTKFMVADAGFEARATGLLQSAYIKSFLKKSKWERTKGGLRSYSDKKWTEGGGRKLIKQGIKYAVAGAAFATLTAITGPGALVILGVGLAATALTKGGALATDEINDFSAKLKKTADPDTLDQDSPTLVMPVVLENEGITTVVKLLFRHWSDFKLFRSTYSAGWKKGNKLEESYKREDDTLGHFQAHDVEHWRNWQDEAGKKTEAMKVRDFSEFFSAMTGLAARAGKKVAKSKANVRSAPRVDVDYMRLKVKKLTFYNACLLDYCRMMAAEQALMQEAVVKAWEQLVSLTQRQAHIRSDHSRCKKNACFGGINLLAYLVPEDHIGHVVVMDDPAPTSPPPRFETIADRAATMKEASAVMNFFRKFPGRRTKSEFAQKKIVETAGKWAAKKAASSTVQAVKTAEAPKIGKPEFGDLEWPKLGEIDWGSLGSPTFNGPEKPDVDPGWPSLGDIDWPKFDPKLPGMPTLGDLGGLDINWPDLGAINAKIAAPGVDFFLKNQVVEPVPGLGALVGDLTDFLFQHFHNLDARDHMKALDKEMDEFKKELEARRNALMAGHDDDEEDLVHGGRIIEDLLADHEKEATEQTEEFFRKRLPSHVEMDNFKTELLAAASKLPHYVKKGDQRRQTFLKLYDNITLGASEAIPAHCKSCTEAFDLAYAFFDMVKTMWKLDQHVMFLDVFAKGVFSCVKEQSATFHFPYQAGDSLAEWFKFWHKIEPAEPSDGVVVGPDPNAAPAPDANPSSAIDELDPSDAIVDVFSDVRTPWVDSEVEGVESGASVPTQVAQPVPYLEESGDPFPLSSSSSLSELFSTDAVMAEGSSLGSLEFTPDSSRLDTAEIDSDDVDLSESSDLPGNPKAAQAPLGMRSTVPAGAASDDLSDFSSDL